MFRTRIVASIVVTLLLISGPALAQSQPNARDLLTKVAETYKKLKSYKFEGKRYTETRTENLNLISETKSEEMFSLAAVKPDRFRAELNTPQYSFSTISNASTEWLYLPGMKQYTKKSKASMKPMTPESFGSNPAEMFANMLPLVAKELLSRLDEFEQLGKRSKGATIVGEDTFLLGDKKIDCYIVDVDYGTTRGPLGDESSQKTLWIDKARSIALRQVAISKSPMPFGGFTQSAVTTHFSLAEINGPPADALFTFVPPSDASEVEKLSITPPIAGLTGKEAANFKLKDINGKEFNLHSLRGNVVLLDFWATWCGPCLVELPHIEKLHREFKDKGLVVLGINAEEAEVASAFMKEKGYTFSTLVDTDGVIAELFGVISIPQVLVIGKDGKVATHFFGTKTEGELRAALEKVGFR